MTASERVGCVRWAAAVVGGRRPVVATLRASDDASVAAAALDAGASAALLLPETGSIDDAERVLRAINAATGGALPIVLYQRGPLKLESDDLRRLAEQPTLAGLKDAFGDMRRFRRLREAIGSRLIWVGASEDLMLAFWAYGADAVSPASLAYAPWYGRRVWDTLAAGDRDEAVRLLRLFAWPVTDLRGRARTSTSRWSASSPPSSGSPSARRGRRPNRSPRRTPAGPRARRHPAGPGGDHGDARGRVPVIERRARPVCSTAAQTGSRPAALTGPVSARTLDHSRATCRRRPYKSTSVTSRPARTRPDGTSGTIRRPFPLPPRFSACSRGPATPRSCSSCRIRAR